MRRYLSDFLWTAVACPALPLSPSSPPSSASPVRPCTPNRGVRSCPSFSSPSTTTTFGREVTEWLKAEGVSVRPADDDVPRVVGDAPGPIVALRIIEGDGSAAVEGGDERVALHVLDAPTSLSRTRPPGSNGRLTDAYASRFGDRRTLIHLHEDVYRSKERVVKARILARLGRVSSRRMARKTTARRVGKGLYVPFLEEHHLWGATRAKFGYGLFDKRTEELVAVATFSSRRHVIRDGRRHRSHELIRCCSRRDGRVVGGITKLIKAFVREHSPDDIVTVVDRDWGPAASSWHGIGFETGQVMPPLPMAVGREDLARRHLVGAGIAPTAAETAAGGSDTSSSSSPLRRRRPGLPLDVLDELAACCGAGNLPPESEAAGVAAERLLADRGFFLVHDCGVERLMLRLRKDAGCAATAAEVWRKSTPAYTAEYYSDNDGITALIHRAKRDAAMGAAGLSSSGEEGRSSDVDASSHPDR